GSGREVDGGFAEVALVGAVVTALGHAEDAAGAGFEDDFGGHLAGLVLSWDPLVDGVLRGFLCLWDQCCVDLQSRGAQPSGAFGLVGAEPLVLLDLLDDVVAEEGLVTGDTSVGWGVQFQFEVDHLGLFGLFLGDGADRGHAVEDHVAPFLALFGEEARGVQVAVADETGDRGCMVQFQYGGGDLAEGLGGGLHAVGTVAEVGDVEVALEDLVLAHLLFQGDGVPQLPDLSGDGLLTGVLEFLLGGGRLDLDVLDVLLGDGGSTFGVAAHGADRGTQGPGHVESTVFVEAGVLGGQDRVDHLVGDVFQFHEFTVLIEDFGDDAALGVVDGGALWGRWRLQVAGH